MMNLHVQYDENGNITGTVTGTNAPDHPRQLVFKPDEKGNLPSHDGMRVDLKTGKMIPCPEIARQRHNGKILSQLRAVDDGTPRALREFYLTGSKTALENLEAKAEELRAQIKK